MCVTTFFPWRSQYKQKEDRNNIPLFQRKRGGTHEVGSYVLRTGPSTFQSFISYLIFF